MVILHKLGKIADDAKSQYAKDVAIAMDILVGFSITELVEKR